MSVVKSIIDRDDIVFGLQELGVREGDTVFVHASLSRFGHVEEGPEGVVSALQALVGASGTVAMPGFTFQLRDMPRPVIDMRHTPCWAGAVYEHFRTTRPVHRSTHITHSVIACGSRAADLTATHSITPCGAQSPFPRLVRLEAKLLLLGVSHNSNTTLHAVEEELALPHMVFRELEGAQIIDAAGKQRPLQENTVHENAKRYDFNYISEHLDRLGIQKQRLIGDAVVRCIDMRDMYEFGREMLTADPQALLRRDEAYFEIPVCRDDLPFHCRHRA